ncbi:MAG TPA: hypothetical protein VKQ30_14515 [Ktedonobacterales bacterium]|nr:hypothetical protein [Ktedonobacterales bacterium]
MTPSGIPPDIGDRVRAAERRRALGVKLCVLAGVCLVAGGLAVYVVAPHSAVSAHTAPRAALLLIGAGLVVTFPFAALLALLLGPTWRQRQQHWQSLRQHRCH